MKIMVSAGEVSGDVHGSYLVRELKKLLPEAKFFGLGSERMAAEGVELKFDLTRQGTIGFFEALPNLLPIFSVFTEVKKLLRKEKPDLVILIDSQGFNLPLAKYCKKNKIKTVYYIAPQEWLWGTPAGVKKVAESVDLIVAIFQKEYETYKKAGATVVYFGHPLIDMVETSDGFRHDLEKDRPLVSLCPGSRTQELKTMFPILLQATTLIAQSRPDVHFAILAASQATEKILRDTPLPDPSRYLIVRGETYDYLAASHLAICTSGTINFETSLLGTPNIMTYRLSPLTYWIGKHILHIDKKIKYFSMPNILLDAPVIPELVMSAATPTKIAQVALDILNDQPRQDEMKHSFDRLRGQLGEPGVIARCAAAIVGHL